MRAAERSGTAVVMVVAILLALCPRGAAAEALSLLAGSAVQRGTGAFIALPRREGKPGAGRAGRGASLFAGREGASMFAPLRKRAIARVEVAAARRGLNGPAGAQAERIRHLIGRAEAGRDSYDAIQHGARIRPTRPPTQMTIAEIFAWIAATPGQHHAIGRYQFIPETLRRLVAELRVPPDAVFSPIVQDRLADRLLEEAGLHAFLAQEMDRTSFMNNLARIWAGLPTSSGKSFYHGVAGNRATMTWAEFTAEMARIFPG